MSLCVGVAKHHMTASAPFFRENLLRMRQKLITFLGSLECTVHVIITPLYHYGSLRVMKHVHTFLLHWLHVVVQANRST